MAHTKGRVIEIALHFPEEAFDFELELRQESAKSGHTRKAGPAGTTLEVFLPEDFGSARFLPRVGDLCVLNDLARALKRDARVEASGQSLQESGSGLGAGKIERIEDLVDGKPGHCMDPLLVFSCRSSVFLQFLPETPPELRTEC